MLAHKVHLEHCWYGMTVFFFKVELPTDSNQTSSKFHVAFAGVRILVVRLNMLRLIWVLSVLVKFFIQQMLQEQLGGVLFL